MFRKFINLANFEMSSLNMHKTHPPTGFKLCSKPNRPTRAFRIPDKREAPFFTFDLKEMQIL